MALRRNLLGVPWRKVTRPKEVPVDELDGLCDAVVGDGLIMITGRKLRLYEVDAGRARHLGTFGGAVSAWRCLDALDMAASEARLSETDGVAADGHA